MKKKILAIIFALCISILAIGCENVEYPSTSTPAEESKTVYEQIEEELPEPEKGENGEIIKQTFTIATDEKEVYLQEENVSGSISKAVEKRNTFLYDKYGAEINVIEIAPNDLAKELKLALESGTNYCDMISVSAKESTKLYTLGLLGDMSKLPEFDIANAYFDAKNAQALATNNSVYMLADPTTQFYGEAYVLFFNRDLVEKVGGKDPEILVMQGKWTWDAFNEVARAAAPKVYANASSDLTIDTFGFGAYYNQGTFPLVMWTSAGTKLVDNTYKNTVELSMSVEEIQAIAKPLQNAYNTRGRYPMEGEDVANAFKNGRLAFMVHKFSYFYSLRTENEGENYGFLPLPKLSEDQTGYNCLVSSDARVISIPKTLDDDTEARKRFVSLVISATCASGRKTVKQAFINEHIGLYLTDNEETVMLETICDSATFDFANVYGSVISEIRRPTTTAVSDYIEFGSALNSSISRTLAAFNKYSSDNFK